jgi:hypothetical protein
MSTPGSSSSRPSVATGTVSITAPSFWLSCATSHKVGGIDSVTSNQSQPRLLLVMHCTISWDVSDVFLPPRNVIDNELVGCLRPHPFAKPLTTFYIVQVPSQAAYDALISRLMSVSQKYPGRCRIVATPLMVGGRYNGILQQNEWVIINSLSS